MNSFSVKAQMTKAEFVRMSVLRTYTNPVILFFSSVGIAALVFGLLQYTHVIPRVNTVPLYPTLFIGIYFCIAFPFFNAWLAARNYRRGVLSARLVMYTFSEEGLHLQSGDDIDATMPWTDIVRKQRVGKHLLLFTDRVSAFILPIDGFTEANRQWLGEHVPRGRI